MDNSDHIYIKAFNHAYFLAKYNAIILEKILESPNDNEYYKGLRDGNRTFKKEQKISRSKEIEKINLKKSKDKNLER